LRYNKNTDTLGLNARNIGVSKGMTFERVLLFPTKRILKYTETGERENAGDIYKFYIAITRAKYSVAFAAEKIPKKLIENIKIYKPLILKYFLKHSL
jgi:hypothetical protein